MIPRFRWCVDRVLEVEGDALTDDPDDPGGLTKYGISKKAHPDVDIANLTRDGAIDIYRRDYWNAVSGDKLPEPLDAYVFDCAVNQGVSSATKWLQRVVGVREDGVIGGATLGGVYSAPREEIAALFMAQRALHYASLPTFPKYGKGWMKRLFLVSAQHQSF